jgi:3-dehydroquinate synthase
VSSIRVTTPQAAYDVTIAPGLLRTLYPACASSTPVVPPRTFVITSPEIWALWHTRFLASFPADAQPPRLFLPAGERHKRLATVESLANQLVLAGADRDSILLAFGGGVIGDVTGFLAAIYMRGIRYVGLPTTILAQVDSSLGGKTGVNLLAGKNLIGSFHHPLAVYSRHRHPRHPPRRRTPLRPPGSRQSRHHPLRPKSSALWNRTPAASSERGASHKPGSPASPPRRGGRLAPEMWDSNAIQKVITASVRVKADVVSKDEKESGLRMILNFGHTIGHAIEAATHYRKLLHGEAVAWGSIAALHVSLNRGRISHEDFARMANLILRYGPIPPFRADPAKLVALTSGDKKKRSGRRAFVLTTGIGHTEIAYDVTDAELLAATTAMLDTMQGVAG